MALVKPIKSTFSALRVSAYCRTCWTSISSRLHGHGAETITSQESCFETMTDNTQTLNIEVSQQFVLFKVFLRS